jgi:decaprenylphospho-beta-D-ribofuranose 2-oxidase
VTSRIVSFDGTEECRAPVDEPDRYRTLFRALSDDPACAVRGSGLSYCLASSGDDVTTISTRQFSRVLGFDRARRLVSVEAGMTVGDLCDFVVARGCYFPVLPGHPSISLGGCAGFNVHGKTQHNIGHFSDHVESLTLFHPDHGEVRCSAREHAELFDLTLGGMGLTGCITELTLRLQPLAGPAVRRRVHAVANLDDAIARMHELSPASDALYSWNDLNARGGRFGQGVVYQERFEPGEVASRTRYRRLDATSRDRLPFSAWTGPTARAVNALYPRRETWQRERVRSVHDAAFPINGNEAYFRLFGSDGLREYQVVLPFDAWSAATQEVERALDRHPGAPVTLGSLKLFAGGRRHLWFRADGVCLTIDTPARPAALALFDELDRITLDHGGIVNLSKDSRLTASTVRAVFPEYDGFADALATFDPKRRFDTALRRRLEL